MPEHSYQSIATEETYGFSDLRLRVIDRVIIFFYVNLIAAILIIAGWSGILLATGNTEGGGPLGAVARVLHINCLACFAEFFART